MTTIDDLFFGELSLNLTGPEGNKQYRAAAAVWDDCEERLNLLLGGKERTLLIRLLNAHAEILGVSEAARFRQGFSLGLCLAAEAFLAG
ncbi:DUF6809 family protein [Anaerotruncus rubiinfantis]|uniref:DUF6809 family protein n=1 Tax=Anaerotruncus rubiinfantis TaxID=1720200 RepID=UPI00189A4E8C|nr:DUF6809 family protein [Anaerotruncus rubiinfantis]